MANTLTRGYTFGATELVTNAKLHTLVDSGTATIDTVTVTGTTENTFTIGDGAAGDKKFAIDNGDVNLPNLRFNDTSNKWEFSNDGTTWEEVNNNTNVTAAPSADTLATGLKITLTAGSTVAFGDVCYIASTGKAVLADATAIATSSAVVMALGSINADASGSFLLNGVARKDAWNWTVGGLVYLTITGTSTNTLSQTAPTATDEVIQIIGVATHADRIYFNPSLSQVEHS